MVGEGGLLQDRYRLGSKIATGGMGSVYRATDEKLGRTVAMKLLAANLAEDSSFVERFRREARAAAGLRHPKIANVFDAGEEDNCHFIVMELAEGRDLARVLREDGPLPPDRAVWVIDQICLALSHAHSAGIIHRDIKPANIILSDDDSVKVTDFGIARAADDSKLTATGSVLGTAHYISPEQAEGKPLTPASDIYSLGIVMFETLTGALPFTGESLMAVAMRHINEQIPPPSSINDLVRPELDEIVERATRKDPGARYADAMDMHEALTAVLQTRDGTTAVLPAMSPTEPQHTVWPIPGDRWDPTSLGRKVLLVFGFLILVALALLVWRITSADPIAAEGPGERPTRSASQEAPKETFTIGDVVIGLDYRQAQEEIEAAGFDSEVVFLEDKELVDFLLREGIDPELAEEGEVIGTDPRTGETLAEGQTITLFVSSGVPTDEDVRSDPKGKAKGHGKKEEDD